MKRRAEYPAVAIAVGGSRDVAAVAEQYGVQADTPAPEEVVAAKELERRIRSMLAPLQRQVFDLMLQGASAAEMSEELGLSVSRVRRTIEDVREIARAFMPAPTRSRPQRKKAARRSAQQ